MSETDLAAWRMHTHHLWGTPFARPDEVVRRFGAMQAQEFAPAKWAIGQRATRAIDPAVEQLYASGELVRTHVVRPTWHFVHRDDIRWMLAATKARVHQLNGTYYRRFGVDGDTFAQAVELFSKALRGGNELTRKELAEVLRSNHIEVASGLHMSYVLMRAELDAVIVSGTVGGKAPTYASFDDRVPETRSLPDEEALAELTRRYFLSRGPATLKDYVRWSSLTVAEARQGLAAVRSELESARIGAREYWYGTAASGRPPTSPRVDLVQGYDEYVMSYSDSKDVIHPLGPVRSGPIDLNVYVHAILVDGLVAGHWRLVRSPKEVIAELVLRDPQAMPEAAAIDAAVARLGAHFQLPASWTTAAHTA